MVYVEFPFDNIVNVHWKKKPTDGGPDTYPPGPCASGWFPFGGYFDGGDGFPPQVVQPPVVLNVGPNTQWNFWSLTQPRTSEELIPFYIPGGGATSVIISVVWAGQIPPVTGPPLTIGIWIIPPGHGDRPPFPGVPYPFDPDLSAPMNSESGSLAYTLAAPGGAILELGFAGTSGRSSAAAPSPFMPSARDEEVHYGWPGAPPSEGIWITVDYACGGLG